MPHIQQSPGPRHDDQTQQPTAEPTVVPARTSSVLLRTCLLTLRGVWRSGWDLMPAFAQPLRVWFASSVRALLGMPVLAPIVPYDRKSYHRWINVNDTLTDADRRAIREHISSLSVRPVFSVLMPVYNTEPDYLRAAIKSVRLQLYPDWELCIADDASSAPHVREILAEEAATEGRIRLVHRETNGHIAAASNTALSLARGDYIVLLDHDDVLAENALYECAAEIAKRPDADVLYSDEDKIDADGVRYDAYFKPDFDPDLLLSHNLISHLGVYRRDLVERIGGFREGFEGSQDHDLALRATGASNASRIRHIPAILYHWRQTGMATSFSESSRDRCAESSQRAVADWIAARGVAAKVERSPLSPDLVRVTWAIPQPEPLVSVIVPTRDHAAMLGDCADGVLTRTNYKKIEFLIVDNGSEEPETAALFKRLEQDPRVRVIPAPGPFNYSAINNRAVAESKGDVLLLLNNDIDVIGPEWLDEMVAQVMRPDVGAVGAKLFYPNDTLQHGGVVVGAGGVAGHYILGAEASDPGHFQSLNLVRQCTAVTAACLAIRASIYREVGGLNEQDLTVAYNDVDFCLRVGERGYRNIWTPFARLYHRESVSRGLDLSPSKAARFAREVAYMQRRWGTKTFEDPFYNPNLDLSDPNGRLAPASRRIRPWQAKEHAR